MLKVRFLHLIHFSVCNALNGDFAIKFILNVTTKCITKPKLRFLPYRTIVSLQMCRKCLSVKSEIGVREMWRGQ